jgi:hypothetical protein
MSQRDVGSGYILPRRFAGNKSLVRSARRFWGLSIAVSGDGGVSFEVVLGFVVGQTPIVSVSG